LRARSVLLPRGCRRQCCPPASAARSRRAMGGCVRLRIRLASAAPGPACPLGLSFPGTCQFPKEHISLPASTSAPKEHVRFPRSSASRGACQLPREPVSSPGSMLSFPVTRSAPQGACQLPREQVGSPWSRYLPREHVSFPGSKSVSQAARQLSGFLENPMVVDPGAMSVRAGRDGVHRRAAASGL